MAYNLLKGKRGIIFGALNDASIAWKVAERASEEGAQIVLTNTPVACRMGTIDELAKKTNATIIPADATSVDDLEKLFAQAQEVMGGKIDFVLHSVAMSVNMRKKRTYDDLDYGFLNKTLDISAISFHKMIQTAKKLDGRCKVVVGIHRPQLRLHLWARERSPCQYDFPVSDLYDRWRWHQGFRRFV